MCAYASALLRRRVLIDARESSATRVREAWILNSAAPRATSRSLVQNGGAPAHFRNGLSLSIQRLPFLFCGEYPSFE